MKNVTRDKFDHKINYEFCVAHRNKVEEGTLTGYRWTVKSFLEHIEGEGVDLENIDWTDIDSFIDSMVEEYSQSTTKTRYNHLRSFIKWLRARKGYYTDSEQLPIDSRHLEIKEYIDRGETKKGNEASSKEGVVFVEAGEYELLKENVPAPKFRNELILKMLWHLGLRRMEVTEMQITPEMPHKDEYGNIDFGDNEITVPDVKGGGRELWFRDSLAAPLRRWIESERQAVYYADESQYLFPSRNSEQLTPKRVTSMVDQAAQNAGIQSTVYVDANGNERRRITPHALRHGYGVRHVRNGTDVRTLQQLMGHHDISVTQHYLQFKTEARKRAQHRNAPEV
ncbi:tyrosine-type recombinase/integrase [Natronoarchaeum philippinense]|uniref:Site-specific recombinase XerD n=1 Tax=Natronoarchaeum philippinense TaxID=558529 RepID=A0A285NTQ5_NATPI|nr:site-specific integrase [Natronoarchaeum philippinense]SNZ12303.1 Site-specific recombinase XerD [Natronoarchaeum philippinense]